MQTGSEAVDVVVIVQMAVKNLLRRLRVQLGQRVLLLMLDAIALLVLPQLLQTERVKIEFENPVIFLDEWLLVRRPDRIDAVEYLLDPLL